MKRRNKRRIKRIITGIMAVIIMICSLGIGCSLALMILSEDTMVYAMEPEIIQPETEIIYEYDKQLLTTVDNCHECEQYEKSKDWDEDESYLLAKIAMAEAEECDTHTKCLVIMTVLNRVLSDEFPNTIEEVIFQNNGKVYQFSPIGNGRWNRVEPDEDCWKAVNAVMESQHDYSQGSLYFESCDNEDNWHNRNLNLLYERCGIRFYN